MKTERPETGEDAKKEEPAAKEAAKPDAAKKVCVRFAGPVEIRTLMSASVAATPAAGQSDVTHCL